MNTPNGDGFELDLETEIKAELSLAESSHAEEVAEQPVSQWLFDPVEEKNYEIELHGLLDSVEELEGHPREQL